MPKGQRPYPKKEKASLKPMIAMYCRIRKNRDGISDTELISGEELSRRDMSAEGADQDDMSDLNKRMDEYMSEFEKNGVDNLTIEV